MFNSVLITNSPVLILHRKQRIGKPSPGGPTIITSDVSELCVRVCMRVLYACLQFSCMCRHTWRPQDDVGMSAWLFLHLTHRVRISHLSPELCLLGCQSSGDPPVSILTAVGLKACSAAPSFYMGARDPAHFTCCLLCLQSSTYDVELYFLCHLDAGSFFFFFFGSRWSTLFRVLFVSLITRSSSSSCFISSKYCEARAQ